MGILSLVAATAPARTVFVSPSTRTQSGLEDENSSPNLMIASPVCLTGEPDPMPRNASGLGSPSSSKNTSDIWKS